MILANFIFVAPHLKTHSAVCFNTSKARRRCSQTEKLLKAYQLSLFLL